MRKRLDIALAMAIVLISGAGAEDARRFSARAWEALDAEERLVTAATAVLAAAYAAEYIEARNPGLGRLSGWIPYWMSNTEGVRLVEMVYGYERYRLVPYIDILLRPDYWYGVLGIPRIGG